MKGNTATSSIDACPRSRWRPVVMSARSREARNGSMPQRYKGVTGE